MCITPGSGSGAVGLSSCRMAGTARHSGPSLRASCPSLETEVPWRPKRRREQALQARPRLGFWFWCAQHTGLRGGRKSWTRRRQSHLSHGLVKNTTGVQPGTKWSRAHFPVRVRRRHRLRSGHGDADSCTKSYPLVLVDHSSVVTLARNSMDSEEWSRKWIASAGRLKIVLLSVGDLRA